MKNILFTLFLLLFISINILPNPTDSQIQEAADILGIPYANLREFVQSYMEIENILSMDVIAINERDLYRAFVDNRLRADQLYKGKLIQTSGTILFTGTNRNMPEIAIGTGLSMRLSVVPRNIESIASLRRGQDITFIGICEGIIMSGLLEVIGIRDAIILE